MSILFEKISQKKAQYFPNLFSLSRNSSRVPFLDQEKTQDLQRQAFLGRMTRGFFHDLLSPLGALQLYIQHVQTLIKDTTYTAIAEDIHKELCNFITTIQYNLQNPEEITTTSLQSVCSTASTLLKHKMLQNNIRLVILGDATLTIKTQSLYLIQVITNGLSNAIDAYEESTSEERTITITYQQKKDRIIIHIHDYGVGVPPEMQKNIFELYTSTKKDGHGIGLAITKQIVTSTLKGTISLTSKPGEGTTLSCDLPMDLQSSEH